MRRTSARRLISRTSELFVGDPELMEVADNAETSADVSAVVASQLGKPTPRKDKKSLCYVLFSDKEQKEMHGLADQPLVTRNSSVSSTAVSFKS